MLIISSAEVFSASELWNVKGNGFAEKSFVRISLELIGNVNLEKHKISEISRDVVGILSSDSIIPVSRDIVSGVQSLDCLTSYDVNLRINAFTQAGFDIKIWDDYMANVLSIPILFPDFSLTMNDPLTLPAVKRGNLTYQVTLTSAASGKLRVTGYVNTSELGDIEINTDCALWKNGTAQPEIAKETKSGCNSGLNIYAFMMMLLSGVYFIVRN